MSTDPEINLPTLGQWMEEVLDELTRLKYIETLSLEEILWLQHLYEEQQLSTTKAAQLFIDKVSKL